MRFLRGYSIINAELKEFHRVFGWRGDWFEAFYTLPQQIRQTFFAVIVRHNLLWAIVEIVREQVFGNGCFVIVF